MSSHFSCKSVTILKHKLYLENSSSPFQYEEKLILRLPCSLAVSAGSGSLVSVTT